MNDSGYLVLDIETGDIDEDMIAAETARLIAEWTPPGNVSKPETIAAKRAEFIESAPAMVRERAALRDASPITVIGAMLAGEIVQFTLDADPFAPRSHLIDFRDWCHSHPEICRTTVIVGSAVGRFDLPKLRRAYALERISPPRILALGLDGRPELPVCDIGQTFAYHYSIEHRDGRASLRDVCLGLGLEAKADGAGAMAPRLWAEGRIEELLSYNRADLEQTEAAYLMMMT